MLWAIRGFEKLEEDAPESPCMHLPPAFPNLISPAACSESPLHAVPAAANITEIFNPAIANNTNMCKTPDESNPIRALPPALPHVSLAERLVCAWLVTCKIYCCLVVLVDHSASTADSCVTNVHLSYDSSIMLFSAPLFTYI